jgi:hypothetical protein
MRGRSKQRAHEKCNRPNPFTNNSLNHDAETVPFHKPTPLFTIHTMQIHSTPQPRLPICSRAPSLLNDNGPTPPITALTDSRRAFIVVCARRSAGSGDRCVRSTGGGVVMMTVRMAGHGARSDDDFFNVVTAVTTSFWRGEETHGGLC